MLQLDALLLLLLLLLELLQVLHLLHLLSLLLHDVGLRTQSGVLDPLVVHHLRQAGGGVAIVEGGHQPVLPCLVQTALTTWSSPQGVELAWLAHAAVHPRQPITLAVHTALAASARHGQMGETWRQRVKLHSSQLLLVWHHHVVHSEVRVRHTLQMVQGYRWRLLEG